MAASEPKKMHAVIGVQTGKDGIYFLRTAYRDSDAATEAGYVLRTAFELKAGDTVDSILRAGLPLNSLWCSPEGNLWVGSDLGLVLTTAPVQWSGPGKHKSSIAVDRLNWQSVLLPKMEKLGYTPMVKSLWGTSDNNVYVGTYKGGSLYHWNGRDWNQVAYGGEDFHVMQIHGSSDHDVYAVGAGGSIRHFDGTSWTTVAGPEEKPSLVAVKAVSPDEVYIAVGNKLFRGDAKGFKPVAELSKGTITGMSSLNGRLILGANTGGWEWTEGRLASLKDTFDAGYVFEGPDRIFFTEAFQKIPAFIEYIPSRSPSWYRRTFTV